MLHHYSPRNQIKAILSGIIQRNALVYANRARPYLMAAFNYGLKADNDPMNTNVGMMFGLDVNPVLAIPKQSSAEKWGVYVANACGTACHFGAVRLGDECRHR